MIKNKLTLISVILFALLTVWWGYLFLNDLSGETDEAELFSASYGIMALYGGIVGLFVSRKFGGMKSLIGKAATLLSVGLLFQEIGQITYSLYTYLFEVEIPYPSWGDVGFFGSVIFYIVAMFFLIDALSFKSTFASKKNLLAVVTIPLALLAASYAVFLKGYEFDFSAPLVVFLDLGYPLGQAFYISLAILAFVLSRKYLGGIMKPAILFLIFALFAQYVSDFTFLYSVNRETWETGGINDYTYLVAYFTMTLALIRLGNVTNSIGLKKSDKNQPIVSAGTEVS